MKDEFAGKIALEFVGLRSKMYCLLNENNKNMEKFVYTKAKGVKKYIIIIEFEI